MEGLVYFFKVIVLGSGIINVFWRGYWGSCVGGGRLGWEVGRLVRRIWFLIGYEEGI